MLTKNDLLDSLLRENEIVRHLATKVPASGLEHRLTEGQRSSLELLRYCSFCGIGGALAMSTGNWDGYKQWSEKSSNLSFDEIPAALDRQADAFKGFFAEVTDEAFANQTAKTPLGEELPLGRALLETSLKWMTAYRMQLFLQAKSAGNAEIGTANCWGGVDMPAG